MKLSLFDLMIKIQEEMNSLGENLEVDGYPGRKTMAAMEKFDFEIKATRITEPPKQAPVEPERKAPPWYAPPP